MSERRKYKRVEVNVAIKGKIIDPQKKIDITGDILLKPALLNNSWLAANTPMIWASVAFELTRLAATPKKLSTAFWSD